MCWLFDLSDGLLSGVWAEDPTRSTAPRVLHWMQFTVLVYYAMKKEKWM